MEAIEGIYSATPPSLGDGAQAQIQLDSSGATCIAPPSSVVVGGTITRPADTTAYAAGDLVANSTTAGSVVANPIVIGRVNGGTGCIRRVRLTTSKTTGLLGTEQFRVRFYKLAPTVGVGDNAPFTVSSILQVNGIAAIFIGKSDVTLSEPFTDGGKGIDVPNKGSEVTFDCDPASKNIFFTLETITTYTPISGEVFTVAVEAFRD